MSRPALTLKALGERIARPPRAWRNRHLGAPGRGSAAGRRSPRRCPSRSCSATPSAGRRCSTAAGGRSGTRSRSAGLDLDGAAPRPAARGASGRPASGSTTSPRSATGRRGRWRRPGCRTGSTASARGGGPGWEPERGRPARQALGGACGAPDPGPRPRRRATASGGRSPAHQRYLRRAWPRAAEGLPRLRALAGLVWSGIVLPHPGHAAALAEMAALAEALVDARRRHAVARAGGPGRDPDPADLDGAAARGRRPARDGAAPAGDRARGAGAAPAPDGRRRRGALPRRRRRRARAGSTRRWPSSGWSRSRSRAADGLRPAGRRPDDAC